MATLLRTHASINAALRLNLLEVPILRLVVATTVTIPGAEDDLIVKGITDTSGAVRNGDINGASTHAEASADQSPNTKREGRHNEFRVDVFRIA